MVTWIINEGYNYTQETLQEIYRYGYGTAPDCTYNKNLQYNSLSSYTYTPEHTHN